MSLSAAEAAEAISTRKARAAGPDVPQDSLVIAADTLVVVDARILGKPSDAREATDMLSLLSDREHSVVTGVSVLRPATGELWSGHETTRVRFRTIVPTEIAAYVRTDEPFDKAGAYGIQGRGALFADRLTGDYTNVVGLPLLLTGKLLARALGMVDLEFLLDIQ